MADRNYRAGYLAHVLIITETTDLGLFEKLNGIVSK